jgi:predicted PurR-regulated permease PerM
MSTIDPGRVKQVGFLVLLVVLAVLLFIEMEAFIPAFLGAVTFYIIMRSQMNKLVEKRGFKPPRAAALLMILSLLIVMIPIWVLVSILTSRISSAIQNSNEFLAAIQKWADGFEAKVHVKLLTDENIKMASTKVASVVPGILGTTFNIFTTIAILYFILYFMLVNSRSMEKWLYEYIPLKDENIEWIGKEMNILVFSNALGVPAIAFLQGVVALIGYLIFGVPDPMFWFVVTAIASMLPFIGAAAGYIPLAVLLLAQGPAWKGYAVAAWGLLIVGLVDNVFRIIFQKRFGDIHPLITVFGVVIGVNMFGFIGLIFGPILISMFLLLVKIYMNEFSSSRTIRREQADSREATKRFQEQSRNKS